MKTGFQYFCFICASLFAVEAFAQDMSGWSDKTICRLLKDQDKQEIMDEAKNRGLSCIKTVTISNQKKDSNRRNVLPVEPIDIKVSLEAKSCTHLNSDAISRKCVLIGKLETKRTVGKQQDERIWTNPQFLEQRINQNGDVEIIGFGWDRVVANGSRTNKRPRAEIFRIAIDLDNVFQKEYKGTISLNSLVSVPISARRVDLADIDNDGLTELVFASNLEDGRGSTTSWADYNYIFDFEDGELYEFSEKQFSHDLMIGDFNLDSELEILDFGRKQGNGKEQVSLCTQKAERCKSFNISNVIGMDKSSLSIDKDGSGIIFGNCKGGMSSWCWASARYSDGRLTVKKIDDYEVGSGNIKFKFKTWTGDIVTKTGSKVEGYSPYEKVMMDSDSWNSSQFDIDADGDFDTVTSHVTRVCSKLKSEAYFEKCQGEGRLMVFENQDSKFNLSYSVPANGLSSTEIKKVDFNGDGNLDLYGFTAYFKSCEKQLEVLLLGNGDGTFKSPYKSLLDDKMGQYGCELGSYFFTNEGNLYRAFLATESMTSQEVYVGLEQVGGSPESLKAQVFTKVNVPLSNNMSVVGFATRPLYSQKTDEKRHRLSTIVYDQSSKKRHIVDFVISYGEHTTGSGSVWPVDVELFVSKTANVDLFGESWWWLPQDLENDFDYGFILNVLSDTQKSSLKSLSEKLPQLYNQFIGDGDVYIGLEKIVDPATFLERKKSFVEAETLAKKETESAKEAQRKKDIVQREKTEALEFAAFMAERKAKAAAAETASLVDAE
jgi:hypothetical protein